MGFKGNLFGLIAIIFFAVCIFGFTITFLTESNPGADVLKSKYGLNDSYNNMTDSLDNLQGVANEVKTSATNAKAESTNYLFLIFQGGIGIPLALIGFIFSGLNTFSLMVINVFTQSNAPTPIVIGLDLIISGLVIAAVVAFVKFVRTGEGER